MKTIYEDRYIKVEVGGKYGYVRRMYLDTEDIIAKVSRATALEIVGDLQAANVDPNALYKRSRKNMQIIICR